MDIDRMQKVFESGDATVEMRSGSNLASFVFHDYIKSGDGVALTFNPASGRLTNYTVTTYLDYPDDNMSVNSRFSVLPDGTSYIEEQILVLARGQLQLKATNFAHKKAGQCAPVKN
jgi:hypothetical protein